MTSYVLRFINNSLAKIRKTLISTKELKYAEKLLIYSNQKKIITSSKFSQLKKPLEIFYDKENILRVRGDFVMLMLTIALSVQLYYIMNYILQN